jgi:hypothetical protein
VLTRLRFFLIIRVQEPFMSPNLAWSFDGAANCDAAAFAIVLTNYARPWNLPRQIETCHRVSTPAQIFLVDNSETPDGSNLPPVARDDITLLRTGRNMGNGRRFALAAALPHRLVMCIDDDIFLEPAQIDALFERAAHEPERVHGVWGEDVNLRSRLGFKTHLCRQNREVDVLNRLYVITPRLARRALELAALCGYSDWSKIGPIDDIFISYAGKRKPACHDVGPLEDCPSSDQEGIASWRSRGFFERRKETIARLCALKSAPSIAPAALYRAR